MTKTFAVGWRVKRLGPQGPCASADASGILQKNMVGPGWLEHPTY